MRIEIVVDVPDFEDRDAVDAIDLGNDVVRRVRNDLHGFHAELVHVAVGPAAEIVVPRDFADGPVHSTYSERALTNESVTPHNEDRDDNHVTPYRVDADEEPEVEERRPGRVIDAEREAEDDGAAEDDEAAS